MKQFLKNSGGEYYFTVSASKLKFDGFMAVYTQEDDTKIRKSVFNEKSG